MSKRRNNPLCQVGTLEVVDVETGESVPAEGGGLRMLPGPPGTCEYCHVKHDHDQPHDNQSLSYQIKFQAIHGRPPTWSDAMSHCTPEVREQWRERLVFLMHSHGMEIPEDLR